MAKGDEYLDKMLKAAESGQGPKNLKEQSQMLHGLEKGKGSATPQGGGAQKPGATFPKIKDYAPSNISPPGDIGILDDKEQAAFFPRKIKGADAECRSSKYLAVKNKVRVMGDKETAPRIDANSPIYPQYDKGDYSGMKAGTRKSKGATGVTPPHSASEGGYREIR